MIKTLHNSVRIAAIIPWLTLLFATIATILMLRHWRAAKKGVNKEGGEQGLTQKEAEG